MDNESENPLSVLHNDLFQGGRERVRQTRSERRRGRQEHWRAHHPEEEPPPPTLHELDLLPDEIKKLQGADPTLQGPRRTADEHPAETGRGFFRRDGLVYRRWVPTGKDSELLSVEQLLVPQQCRAKVLELAHSIPFAGHLGKAKTSRRILQRFYWPTLYADVAQYCRTCGSCQKNARRGRQRVPLVPLPVMEVPFERVAMDIVGPLPRSLSGYRYILVVCDYATRYPEAFPLRLMDAASIAEELVHLFSRVGIPREILTDQGTNFTSNHPQ